MLSLQGNCPFLVSQRDLFIIIDLVAHLLSVIVLVVVPGNEGQLFELGSGEVDLCSAFPSGGVLHCDQDAVAFPVVADILSSGLAEFCPFSLADVDVLKASCNKVGVFFIVYSGEVHLF